MQKQASRTACVADYSTSFALDRFVLACSQHHWHHPTLSHSIAQPFLRRFMHSALSLLISESVRVFTGLPPRTQALQVQL